MSLAARIADVGRSLRSDVRIIGAQFGRQDIFFHAGAIAYSALLAGVPFALLVASAVGYFLGATGAVSNDTLVDLLTKLVPFQLAQSAVPIVRGVLVDAEASRSATGLVGLPLFAWFATRFFGTLRGSLGAVFGVDKGRGLIEGKLFDFVYVIIGTLLVTLYLAFNAYLVSRTSVGLQVMQSLGGDPAQSADGVESYLVRFAAITFLVIMFTGLYKFLPSRPVHWESAMWGGLWGAALFEIARVIIFEFVFRAINPASLYSGTLAVIVVVVFWAYYAAVLFLIGGVVARVHELRETRKREAPHASGGTSPTMPDTSFSETQR